MGPPLAIGGNEECAGRSEERNPGHEPADRESHAGPPHGSLLSSLVTGLPVPRPRIVPRPAVRVNFSSRLWTCRRRMNQIAKKLRRVEYGYDAFTNADDAHVRLGNVPGFDLYANQG
jgi:hypothetical protein